MKNQSVAWAAVCLVLLDVLLVVGLAGVPSRAQGGGYDLSWWTVDGGGGASSGGAYTLDGTIGQPDVRAMSGGAYVLSGGFWGGVGSAGGTESRVLYLPVVQRQ